MCVSNSKSFPINKLSLTGIKQSIVLPTKSNSFDIIVSKVVFLLSVIVAFVVVLPPVTVTPVKITL